MTDEERRAAAHALAALMMLIVLLIAAVFLQSYNGREDVVDSQRQACVGFDRTVLIPLANVLRADETGNQAAAADPRQPARTRSARAAEARIEAEAVVKIDGRIDGSLASGLNSEGRGVVRGLGGRAFSCHDAYPDASPLQIFG